MSEGSDNGFRARMRRFFVRLVLGKDHAIVEDPLTTPNEPEGTEPASTTDSPFGTAYVEQAKAAIAANPPAEPKTLAAEKADPRLNRPVVFDPALKQFAGAFRGGEPQFASHEIAESWRRSRTRALRHILHTIAESEFAKLLVIRGSVLLPAWLGERARRPGDLDCVVLEHHWKVGDDSAKRLIDGLVQLLQGSTDGGAIEVPDQLFASEEIWTYERAPGLRVIVPWRTITDGHRGTVQIDFVFGETMPSPPIQLDLVLGETAPISILAASAEQSLAWKLLWLATDSYAAGKDLYDAVLLAEHTSVPSKLLERTFAFSPDPFDAGLRSLNDAEGIQRWYVEWEDFQKEYPEVQGTEKEWKDRLVRALFPTFQALDEPAE